jgi:hypothetical protein
MSKLPPPPGMPAPPAAGPTIPMPSMTRPVPTTLPSPVPPPFGGVMAIPPAPPGWTKPEKPAPMPPVPAPPLPKQPASDLAGWNRIIQEMNTAPAPAPRLMSPGVDFDPATGEVYASPRYAERPVVTQTADDIQGNLTPQQKAAKAAVNNWYVARGRKIMAERNEREARDEMLRLAFPNINWNAGAYVENEGTKRFPVGDGTKIKASLQDNYSIENSEEADAAVAKLPADIAEMLIDWKPTLKKAIYKELQPEYKVIIAPFVTIKAAAPQVELEE